MRDADLERLAELEHVQWCEWASVMSEELSALIDIIEKSDETLNEKERQTVSDVKDRLDRWEKLLIPYSELPEEEKEKDRVYARKLMDEFKQ